MTEEEYNKFWTELVNAESADAHLDGERADKFFEGCMPVEVMAKRGKRNPNFWATKNQWDYVYQTGQHRTLSCNYVRIMQPMNFIILLDSKLT
jgi:hypothetical protein